MLPPARASSSCGPGGSSSTQRPLVAVPYDSPSTTQLAALDVGAHDHLDAARRGSAATGVPRYSSASSSSLAALLSTIQK